MKLCTKCGELVEYSGFYKRKDSMDGLRADCKKCNNARHLAYDRTEHGKAIRNKRQRAYLATERGLAARRATATAFLKSPKGKAAQVRYREKNRLKLRARAAVQYACRRKNWVRGPCAVCGSTEKVEAHHHNGYAKERWLDVQWLCYPCHKRTE